MRVWKNGVMVLFFAGMAACSRGNPQQLLETAQFEEKQHNKEHAVQLYQEILTRYGNSPEAATAAERLKTLKQ